MEPAAQSRGFSRDDVSLADWLASFEEDDGERRVDFCFPTETVRSEYLDTITARSESEVKALLRHLLMSTGELGVDSARVDQLRDWFLEDSDRFGAAMETEYFRRLAGMDLQNLEPAWQGLSWILDLLPRWPQQAIDVLESYFLAHMMVLPDGRIWGIGDAQAIIRAMWIGNAASGAEKRRLVYQLGPIRFEHLVESLYDAMGFTTHLTARSADGGRDILVSNDQPAAREHSLVECKLWEGSVGVPAARKLLGAVAHERATKGILVSGGTFSKPCRDFAAADPRIELLDWDRLLTLLDTHLGADWGRHVDSILSRSLHRTGFADDPLPAS